jgi:hypothetical protein
MMATAILFSMLGQLDIILASWYCDSSKRWEFPLPFIFNQEVSSLIGWEVIYAFIAVSAILIFISGFILGELSNAD